MARGPFLGVLFDLDGVLSDSEPLYLRTINQVLAQTGVGPLTREENQAFIGAPADFTWASLCAQFGLPQPALYYQERYDALLEEVLRRELTLRPDAGRLLGEVERRGLRRAVATSSRRRWIGLKLRVLGLEGYFHAVVAGDDVRRRKPAPDVYLRAGDLAGIVLGEALAIEDSPAGVAAARAAGLYTVALRTPSTEGMDLGQPDAVIGSLDDLDRALFDAVPLHGS